MVDKTATNGAWVLSMLVGWLGSSSPPVSYRICGGWEKKEHVTEGKITLDSAEKTG
jgi:hypothetical protein